MRDSINFLLAHSKREKLTCNQSLFLFAMSENIFTVDLPGEELLDLVHKKYIKSNHLTEMANMSLINVQNGFKKEEKLDLIKNSLYPNLTKQTGEIVKVLAKHLLEGYSSKDQLRLSRYSSNIISLPFLHLFLMMFPTSDDNKNLKWKKHFGVNASKVTLRRITNGTARKFQQIWRTKDIGLFLLATYMFIKESYNEDDDKYYVKKIENYMSEWEYWYDIAQDKLDNGELERFYSKQKVKTSSNTTVI